MLKRKTFFMISVTFILLFMNFYTPTSALAKDKLTTDHTSEYASFGIIKKNNAYFYKNKRIRIFFDEKKNHSFEYSFVDIKGTINIRLLRNKAGSISRLKIIPKKKANKILKDMIGSVSEKSAAHTKKQKKTEYTSIRRCQPDNVPVGIKKAINKKCTKNKWYIIKSSNRKYVYLKKVPKDFAYQIVGNNINIHDIGKRKKGGTVLLSVGRDFNFILTYNSKPVKYTVVKTISTK